jgi:hypothetical protein
MANTSPRPERSESAKAVPYLDFLIWTGVVVGTGLGCLWLCENEWPRVIHPLKHRHGSATDILYALYLWSTLIALLPAFVGYLIGGMRALCSQPERPLHASDRVAYVRLCQGIFLSLALETVLYAACLLLPSSAFVWLHIFAALGPAILPLIAFGWSILVAIRLAWRP